MIKDPTSPSKPPKTTKVIILDRLKVKWDLKLGQLGEIESNKPPTTALQLERLAKTPRKKNKGRKLWESRLSKGKILNWLKRKRRIIKTIKIAKNNGLDFFWGWQSGQENLLSMFVM